VTEAQALEAILNAWENRWLVLHPADVDDPDYVPYTFDNETFQGVARWVRVTVVNTSRQQTTSGPVGSRRFEQRGRIAVQLFGDVNQGALELAQLSDDVRAILEGQTITVGNQEIALFEGESTTAPTDGRWAMRMVVVGFLYTLIG
jgi:hypothetical protein